MMKRTLSWALLAGLTLAIGVGLGRQWQVTALLAVEVDRLRDETRNLGQLRADNERLKRERTPAAEVARIRADYEAASRLRIELEMRQGSSGGR